MFRQLMLIFFVFALPVSAMAQENVIAGNGKWIPVAKNPLSSEQSGKKRAPLSTFTNRIVYLNGVNISNVREQELEDVNIKIDNNGNIYISAPHYETSQESSYHPLMSSEVPHFPKTFSNQPALPQGVFSKEKIPNNFESSSGTTLENVSQASEGNGKKNDSSKPQNIPNSLEKSPVKSELPGDKPIDIPQSTEKM